LWEKAAVSLGMSFRHLHPDFDGQICELYGSALDPAIGTVLCELSDVHGQVDGCYDMKGRRWGRDNARNPAM
jgi:hypothetical protein